MYRAHAIAAANRGITHRFLYPSVPVGIPPTLARSGFSVEKPRIRQSTTTASEGHISRASKSSTKMHIVSPIELVVKQRLNRPVSPHLGIYSWEIMICGALHRNTAILLSGSMYVFGIGYLALPFLGIPTGSAELIAWFGSLPVAVKLMIKWVYGFAFSFHFAHGLRHLIWDTGVMFGNAIVKRTGIAALMVGALAATGLCFV